jgi:predicted dehydrogenase
VKVALAGLGRMGIRHAQVIESLGLSLVAVSDRRPDAYAPAGETCNAIAGARFFDDAGAMIEEIRPELMVVATTAGSHCDLTCRAAAAGARFVLCEKPMAISIAECKLMMAACSAAGTQLAINHQMRFMEQYTRIKAMLASAEFGGLSSATVIAGNFGLAMNGTHYFEAFRFLTGESPKWVSAVFSDGVVANPRGRSSSIALARSGCRRRAADGSTSTPPPTRAMASP